MVLKAWRRPNLRLIEELLHDVGTGRCAKLAMRSAMALTDKLVHKASGFMGLPAV